MTTQTLKDIKIKTTSSLSKVYPVKPNIDGTLKETVGFLLNREEMIDLAQNLLIAASQWDEARLVAFRKKKFISLTHHK